MRVNHPVVAGLSLDVADPDPWIEQGWLAAVPADTSSGDHHVRTTDPSPVDDNPTAPPPTTPPTATPKKRTSRRSN